MSAPISTASNTTYTTADELDAMLRDTYIGGYILSGCLAVSIWDILCFSVQDIRVVSLRRFTWKTAAFIVARLGYAIYIFSVTVFTVAPNIDCRAAGLTFRISMVIARSSTTLLFLFRVDAAYNNNRIVRAFFASMWFATLGFFIYFVVDGIEQATIPGFPYCYAAVVYKFNNKILSAVPALLMEMTNDILGCIAILYALGGATWKERVSSLKKMFTKPHHSRFVLTDSFVQDTLINYWLAILANIVIFILCLPHIFPENGPDVGIMMIHPPGLVVNLLALRVFRNLKLGVPGLLIPIVKSGPALSTLGFKSIPVTNSTDVQQGRDAELMVPHASLKAVDELA